MYSSNLRTPIAIIEDFVSLQKNRVTSVNKKRKEIERQLQKIHDNYKYIEEDKVSYQRIETKKNEINECQNELDNVSKYINSGVEVVLNFLIKEKFVEGIDVELNLTFKGKIASQLREIHCYVI